MIKLKTILIESFELPSDLNIKSSILSKFLASLCIDDIKTKSIKQYRNDGKSLFKIVKSSIDTNWGPSNIKLISKDKTMPDVIVRITTGYTDSNDGYIKGVKNPNEIFILLNKDSFIKSFKSSIEELTDTIKHEIRHLRQLNLNIGFPKRKILNKRSDVFGKILQPLRGGYNRGKEAHHMRDIEFKTNVHSYSFYIKRYLNKHVKKEERKHIFNKIAIGDYNTPISDDGVDNIRNNLNNMRTKDFPRWKLFVKEMYKIIFL